MSGIESGQKAWVTLLTDKSYLPGCLVLNSSLKHHGSKYPLVVMVMPLESAHGARLPKEYRDALVHAGCILREISWLVPNAGGYTGSEARFVDTWTKLGVFGLSEYEQVVLIDSDMLVRKNMDELLDEPLEPGWIAAAHACTCNPMKIPHYPADWIPSNCGHTYHIPTEPGSDKLCAAFQPSEDSHMTLHSINSGTVVLTPGDDIFTKLVQTLHDDPNATKYSFPDQDFLSLYFKHHVKFLGYEYNALKPMRKCHEKIWRDEGVRNVHYIFKDKPWVTPEGSDSLGEQFRITHGWWWDEWRRVESKLGREPWWPLVKGLVAF